MGLIAWLNEIAVKRPLAWICCLLFCCTVFLTSCGGGGSNLPTAQIQPQSETIQTPVPRPQTSGTPVPQPAGSPQIVAQPTSDPAAVGNASPQPQPSQSPEIPASSPTANPGSSPSPGALPSPSGSPPAPAPSRTPRPFPTSNLNPGEIPVGAVVITNAAEQDGVPLTLGQEIVLTAVAGNDQGRDISNQIQWFDQAGELIGRGPTLTYRADQVVMETITARIGGQGSGNAIQLMAVTNDPVAKVSFTVAPEDITVAPGVKVLSDAEQVNVLSLDIAAGILELRSGAGQPTLYVGDVVLGAAGAVPPSRIVGIQPKEGGLRLEFVAALPKEVIERGSATFEQTIDWSGESGEVTIVDIPTQPFDVTSILEPKWSGFTSLGSLTPKGLTVKAATSLDYKPTYSGSIAFDKDVGLGLSEFVLSHTSDISTTTQLKIDGYYDWSSRYSTYEPLPQSKEGIKISFGPVPLYINLGLTNFLEIESALSVSKEAEFNYAFKKGIYSDTITYNPSDQGREWKHNESLREGEWEAKSSSQTNGRGLVVTTAFPQLEVSIFGTTYFSTGLRLFMPTAGYPNYAKVSGVGPGQKPLNLTARSKFVFGKAAGYSFQKNEVDPVSQGEESSSSLFTGVLEGSVTAILILVAAVLVVEALFTPDDDQVAQEVLEKVRDGTIDSLQELKDTFEGVLNLECSVNIPEIECIKKPDPSPTPTPETPFEPEPEPDPIPVPQPSPTTTNEPKDLLNPTPDLALAKFNSQEYKVRIGLEDNGRFDDGDSVNILIERIGNPYHPQFPSLPIRSGFPNLNPVSYSSLLTQALSGTEMSLPGFRNRITISAQSYGLFSDAATLGIRIPETNTRQRNIPLVPTPTGSSFSFELNCERQPSGDVHSRRLAQNVRNHYSAINSSTSQMPFVIPCGTAAHHIVAWDEPQALSSRCILKRYRIIESTGADSRLIDRWENGIILPDFRQGGGASLSRVPGADHGPLHNEDYFTDVLESLYNDMQSVEPDLNKNKPASNSVIMQAKSKMLATLQEIAAELAGR